MTVSQDKALSDRPWVTATSWYIRGLGGTEKAAVCPRVLNGTWVDDGVELTHGITLDDAVLADLCNRRGIRRLALFGSALRNELGPDSECDIDLPVEFEAGHTTGLLGLAAIELELERLLDLRTPADLSRYFRDTVTAEVRPLYDAA